MSEAKDTEILDADIAVVGGGMVGSALACAVSRLGLSVAVVEAREPKLEWPKQEVDLRVSAITRASQHILRNLGVWERMTEMRVTPYREMHVWDAGGSGSIHFDSAEIGEPDLGHIIENRVIQRALWERMRSFENLRLVCPASVKDLLSEDGRQTLVFEDGRRLSAKLVAGADGGDSKVRTLAGIAVRGWAYDQHAIVGTVRPQQHHRETAWQRFMPEGPLAFLPIDDGRCSIVWSTSPDRAKDLMSLDDPAFCSALAKASEYRLGDIKDVGPRGVFPLRLRHAERYVKDGLALVGDAAHNIHPLAGQGVNLGLLDAASLFDAIEDAYRQGQAVSALACLRRYERARKGANLVMLAAMDGFKQLFSNDFTPINLVRNIGLNLADGAVPIKRLIVKRAMGLIGERPGLAKPAIK